MYGSARHDLIASDPSSIGGGRSITRRPPGFRACQKHPSAARSSSGPCRSVIDPVGRITDEYSSGATNVVMSASRIVGSIPRSAQRSRHTLSISGELS
jgi:hypothetical protein